jgi:hypothetical protein
MTLSEKDRLAAEVAERYSLFEEALFGDKRRYPLQEFKAFWEAVRRYAELTKSDPLIHRSVVEVVHVFATSWEWGGSGFRNRFPTMPSGWSPSSSTGTTLTSRVTSRRVYRPDAGVLEYLSGSPTYRSGLNCRSLLQQSQRAAGTPRFALACEHQNGPRRPASVRCAPP